MDKYLDKQYSLRVAQLKQGHNTLTFEVDRTFFEHIPGSWVEEGEVKVVLDIEKYHTHMDAKFTLSGHVTATCDRCMEPYKQPIEAQHRIIYSFEKRQQGDNDEVIYADPNAASISLVQEIYDFVCLAVPLRRVPPLELHRCDPAVLALLGLDAEGNELPAGDQESESDAAMDPRWEALRKLKGTDN